MADMRRVLLYGGSFDPPHLGHVMAATWALALGRFDEVRLVPALGHPFQDKRLSAFDHRCEMVAAAVAHLGGRVRVEPIEGQLPAPSYTIDTVRALSEREPEVTWTLMMGADSWEHREKWREWEALERRVSFVVVGRAGSPDPEGVTAATKLPNVSSTEVRRRVAAGEPIDGLVTARVAELIREHGLYRDELQRDLRAATAIDPSPPGDTPPPRQQGTTAGALGTSEPGAHKASHARVADLGRAHEGQVGTRDAPPERPERAQVIGVLGRGRAARSLVPMLEASGARVAWWWSLGDPGDPGELGPADVVLLAVPDTAIEAAAASLADRPAASEEIWLHLSGARPGEIARANATAPKAAGCMHPLVALTGVPDPAHLRDATAGVDGEPGAIDAATTLATALGLAPRVLVPGTKALYHAAAVTAAGHTVALFSHATALLSGCGFSEDAARAALQPLARGAINNLADATPSAAITGPIARGDLATIDAHLEALDALGDRGAREAYLVLARQALALSASDLDEDTVASLRFLLAE